MEAKAGDRNGSVEKGEQLGLDSNNGDGGAGVGSKKLKVSLFVCLFNRSSLALRSTAHN